MCGNNFMVREMLTALTHNKVKRFYHIWEAFSPRFQMIIRRVGAEVIE